MGLCDYQMLLQAGTAEAADLTKGQTNRTDHPIIELSLERQVAFGANRFIQNHVAYLVIVYDTYAGY